MSPLVKDLLSLVFQMVGFVNTFWGIYATVTIALLGWLFSSKNAWPRQQKIGITLAYALVVLINCAAQYRFNLLLGAAVAELNSAIALDSTLSNVFRDGARNIVLLPPVALLTIHAVVDLAVIYFIWTQHQFCPPLEIADVKQSDDTHTSVRKISV